MADSLESVNLTNVEGHPHLRLGITGSFHNSPDRFMGGLFATGIGRVMASIAFASYLKALTPIAPTNVDAAVACLVLTLSIRWA